MRTLAPLLMDDTHTLITTPAAWHRQRAKLQAAWLNFLGPFPPAPSTSELNVLEETQQDGFIRQRVEFLSESDATQEAYLLLPEGVKEPTCPPLPAVVYFHATHDESYRIPAGLAGDPQRHHAVDLAQRGWVVIAPRNFLYGYRGQQKETAVQEFKRLYPDRLGMSKMLWDGIRCVDMLAALDYVDQAGIVTMGHSLGAKEALYLAAFDERVIAAVSSESGIGLDFSNWDASWYLGNAIHEPEFAMEHHQLIALTAPRRFLLIGGNGAGGADSAGDNNGADGVQSQPYIDAALEIYRLLDVPERLRLIIHNEGHAFPQTVLHQAYDWLEQSI